MKSRFELNDSFINSCGPFSQCLQQLKPHPALWISWWKCAKQDAGLST